MEKYNYYEAVAEDVREYVNNKIDVKDYTDREELEEYLNETLWTNDSVTGNGSGSYWFTAWKAEEALCHNLDLLGEALAEFGTEGSALKEMMESAESCDVTIRCYLLNQAINTVLDELEDAGAWDAEEE